METRRPHQAAEAEGRVWKREAGSAGNGSSTSARGRPLCPSRCSGGFATSFPTGTEPALRSSSRGHRDAPFMALAEVLEARLRRLLAIPESHRVLFLQGGCADAVCGRAPQSRRGGRLRELRRYRRMVGTRHRGGAAVLPGARCRVLGRGRLPVHPGARRVGRGRRLRLSPLRGERDHRRGRVPRRPGRGRRSPRDRHVLEHPVAAR